MAIRASLGAGRQAGRHWRGAVLLSETSPGWEINDAGFETRVDRRTAGALLSYRENSPNRITRQYQVDLMSRHVWNTAGDYLDSGWDVGHVVQWSSYWTHSFIVGWRPGTMSDDITRGGPLVRRPGGWRASFFLSTDARKYQIPLHAAPPSAFPARALRRAVWMHSRCEMMTDGPAWPISCITTPTFCSRRAARG